MTSRDTPIGHQLLASGTEVRKNPVWVNDLRVGCSMRLAPCIKLVQVKSVSLPPQTKADLTVVTKPTG